MIPVHEILFTIQGESTRAGLGCVLVRVLGCNLHCLWCDTDQNDVQAREMAIDEIVDLVRSTRCDLVQLTGGEPLTCDETPALCEALMDAGLTVLVETNGSLDVSVLPPDVICIMDLKPPSSGEDDHILWRNVEELDAEDEIKIVVAHREDYDWARQVLEQRLAQFDGTVILSPVTPGLDPGTLASWILHDGLDVMLGIQLHKLIFPDGEESRSIF